MLEVKKSTIKIDKEGFNDCPPRKYFLDGFKNGIYTTKHRFVDVTNAEYWKNEGDTLVVEVETAEEALRLISKIDADERDWDKTSEGKYVLRFWWD